MLFVYLLSSKLHGKRTSKIQLIGADNPPGRSPIHWVDLYRGLAA